MLKREKISGPNLNRAAKLTDSKLDKEKRTLTLSFSSETPYTRSSYWSDPWVEILGHRDGEMDSTRLDSGAAPVLYGHDSYSRENHIGVVKRAWIEGERGMAEIQLSRRDDLEGLMRDIEDGILSNVSVGYQIHERTLVKQVEGGPNEYRVTSWTPMEISLVAIPADATVGVGRSDDEPRTYVITPIEERNMSDKTNGATATEKADKTAEAERAEGAKAERQRIADINAAVRAAGLPEDFARSYVDNGTSVDAVRVAVLDELAKRQKATPPTNNIGGGRDLTREAAIEGITGAFEVRMNPRAKVSEHAQGLRNLSCVELAKRSLVMFGGFNASTVDNMTRGEAVDRFMRMHTNSDFPILLANVVGKRLRNQYAENVPSYTRWSRRGANLPDFKNRYVPQIANSPDLVLKEEAGPYSTGTVTEGQETYKALTYAKALTLSRELLINDDLSAFDRAITGFAGAARRLENKLVYDQILTNPSLNDGNGALFQNAAVRGTNLAAAGTAITVAALGAGRAVMRKQVGLQGELLNIAPAYLLCGPDKEQEAYQFTSANYVPATSATVNEFRAGGRTALEPIVETYVTGNQWYLIAPNDVIDTVEYAYVDGNEGVFVDSMIDFDTDGLKVKARLDFAAKVIDFRGLYKNPGA